MVILVQFLHPAVRSGPAIGAVAAGPQPPLQAHRVEDVLAVQLGEPVACAAASLQAYGALCWRFTGAVVAFLCCSVAD